MADRIVTSYNYAKYLLILFLFPIRIWTPNVYICNEVDSEVMATVKDSVFVSISSMGEVNYHYR